MDRDWCKEVILAYCLALNASIASEIFKTQKKEEEKKVKKRFQEVLVLPNKSTRLSFFYLSFVCSMRWSKNVSFFLEAKIRRKVLLKNKIVQEIWKRLLDLKIKL